MDEHGFGDSERWERWEREAEHCLGCDKRLGAGECEVAATMCAQCYLEHLGDEAKRGSPSAVDALLHYIDYDPVLEALYATMETRKGPR